jgi:hypothetical protein
LERGSTRSYCLEKFVLEKAKDLLQDRLCDDGVELQASAALLLCQFVRNLRGSGALAGETTPARNRSTIIAFI